MVRLLGVSSSTLTAAGIHAVLADQTDLILVDVVATGRQARDRCMGLSPPEADAVLRNGASGHARPVDVVLLDTHLPGEDPFEIAARLRESDPTLGVVLLGPAEERRILGPAEDTVLVRAATAGISGYLPATAPVSILLAAIRRAADAPDSFTAPDLAGALRRPVARARLSPRECEVLRHLLAGSTLSTIAGSLLVSESTIKTYASRIYDKLGVRGRAQAVDAAIRAGLLP